MVEEAANEDEDTYNVQSTYEVETTRPELATSAAVKPQLTGNAGALPQITLLQTGLAGEPSVLRDVSW